MRLEPRTKDDISDKSVGKPSDRIKPRFNQKIQNQNVANLLVRI